jgi:spermidine synthase
MKFWKDQGRILDLFIVSFLILFLEIALVRWVSIEIRIFSYVNNLVLLACFLGIGIGCYYSEKKMTMRVTLLSLAVLFLLVMAPIGVVIEGRYTHFVKDTPMLLSAFSDTVIWNEVTPTNMVLKTVIGMISTLTVFAIIVITFIPLGRMLGSLLNSYENLLFAYSLNVFASLIGIWCFNLLAFRYQPPWVWFTVVLLGVLWLARRMYHKRASLYLFLGAYLLGLLFIAVIPLLTSMATIWSPYQKLQIMPLTYKERGYYVGVNETGFMLLLDLSDRFIKERPEFFDSKSRIWSQYDIPYRFKKEAADVLIIGAGGGNDAAGALRNRAEHITAVEIDPGIYEIGRQLHPESPYASPKVEIMIDDARSFFKKNDERYDLISFGLLDSHTLASTYNNMRIDHYVYTEESFQEARRLLKEDGVMTVIFEVQREWIALRIAGLLRKTFGEDPVAFWVRSGEAYGAGGLMFVSSKDMAGLREVIAEDSELSSFIDNHIYHTGELVKLTTDDWPYLYLEQAAIPTLHICLSILLLGLFVVGRRMLIPRGQRLNWHFFFLGAAFLLLEFQNISKTTLLFGSTWLVNSFIISSILVLILLANLFVYRLGKVNLKLVYLGLLVSLGIVYILPLSAFNVLSYTPRVIVSSTILNLPIFFAGIVFITSFQRVRNADLAFGSNLLGAGVGGILESVSFVTGIHMLIVLVAILYTASFLCLRQERF